MEEKLSLNELAIAALRESAKWCMFLAIVGFIGIGFMVIAGLFMAAAMSAVGNNPAFDSMNGFGAIKAYIGILYIVIAALYFFPIYYLYKYAAGTKQSLQSGNSDDLSDALVNLKSHHKFLGITTIVVISMYILMIIGVVIFAAKAASGGM